MTSHHLIQSQPRCMMSYGVISTQWVNAGIQFGLFFNNIFKWIMLNENAWISIKISLKFVAKGPINNIPSLVKIMAWCQPGDKPLSKPMIVSVPTHICVTQLQWVNNTCHMHAECILGNIKMVDFLIGHYTYRMFPPAIDIIPTLASCSLL